MGYAEREGLRPQGNVPNLRFPEFSGEWEEISLNDISTINPKSATLEDTFVYVDLEAVEKGVLKKKQLIQRSEAPSRAQRVIKEGDILFQCVRPYQKNNYLHRYYDGDNQWIASTGYAQIRTTECPNYLYHTLNTDEFNKKVMLRCTGSSYPAINSDDLSTIPFYSAPTKREQEKIAYLLDLIDERIATQNKIIEDLKSLIKGLNDSLHENMNGELVAFSDLGEVYSGLAGKSASDFGSGKPYITYLNVYQNTMIDCSQYDYVSVNTNERQNKVHYGDLLFTLSSETADEVGIGSVYLGNEDELYLNSFCFGIHINATDKVYSPYLAFLVSCRQFRRFVYPLAQGSTRFNLQKGDFMKRNFMLPPYAKQVQIADTLNCLATKIANENKLLASYHIQKEHLLRTMFI